MISPKQSFRSPTLLSSALLLVMTTLLLGCQMNPPTQPLVVPKVAIRSEHGFKTMTFGILKEMPLQLADNVSARAVNFAGRVDGEVIECALVVQDSWEIDQTPERPITLWWSAVSFERISVGSDRFLRLLEGVFEQPKTTLPMRDFVVAKVVSLGQDPKHIGSQRLSLKLFFGEMDGVEQSEMYLKIDLVKREIELSEKDPEYRNDILVAFRKTTQ